MTEGDVYQLFRKFMRQELAPIVMGQIVSNESDTRSTIQRFSNEAPRENIRNVQPFGLASKAPAGTSAFIVPAGFDPTNQNILGHFDEANKPVLNDGEVALYDAYGHVLYLSNGKIQLGSEASAENMVLGQVFKKFASDLLDAIANHTHPGIGSPPSNMAKFTALKSSPIGDESILSGVAFTEKGS